MTPVCCCGFECGVAASVSGSVPHWGTLGPGMSFDTTIVRSGARSLRVTPSAIAGTTVQLTNGILSSSTWVTRVYVKFNSSLPDNNCLLMCGASGIFGIAFKQSDSKIYCASIVGGVFAFGATGFTVTTGQWYRLDMKLIINGGGAADTVDAQVDGNSLGQRSVSVTDSASTMFLGAATDGSNVTADIIFEDFLASHTAADYPLGAGHVDNFVTVSDGTHNIAGTGDFAHGTAGSDILNATTDAWTLIDDVPLPTSVSTTDLISAIAPANPTSDYVECKFGPGPGISTPTVGPRAVEWILAHHQAATQTGQMQVKIRCVSATSTVFDTGAAAGVVTLRYARGHLALAPGSTAWNVTGGSAGNFNDLYCRFLGLDAAPDQYLDAIMIEAEFADVVGGGAGMPFFMQQALLTGGFDQKG